MKKVIIFGTGDLAKLIRKYLTRDSPHEIVAFTSHQEFINEKNIDGLPVIPFEKIEDIIEFPITLMDEECMKKYLNFSQIKKM